MQIRSLNINQGCPTLEHYTIFYTLIANCRLHGIDPHGYFKEVLERLPSCTNHQLAGLLPANWAKRNCLQAAG